MYFLTFGLWRLKLLPSSSTRPQIEIVHYNDQKWRLLITESELWLPLLPQVPTNRRSDLSNMASNVVTQRSCSKCSPLQKTRHKILKRELKIGGRPVLARGDGQKPSRSWKAVKLVSRCLPARGHHRCLCFPRNGCHRNPSVSAKSSQLGHLRARSTPCWSPQETLQVVR